MDDFIRQSSDERRVFFEQTAARMRRKCSSGTGPPLPKFSE
jgi:hypothetical protein